MKTSTLLGFYICSKIENKTRDNDQSNSPKLGQTQVGSQISKKMHELGTVFYRVHEVGPGIFYLVQELGPSVFI